MILVAGILATGLGMAALPAQAALVEGQSAPDFTLQASRDGFPFSFTLSQALKAGPVVVYFYPSAFTQGCNIQAHEFSERAAEFSAAGASVVGVSLDGIERLNAFSADPQYCAGRVPVASDPQGSVARAYDLPIRSLKPGQLDSRGQEIGHDVTSRTSYVVGRDGRIAAVIDGVSPSANVEAALAAVRRLSHP